MGLENSRRSVLITAHFDLDVRTAGDIATASSDGLPVIELAALLKSVGLDADALARAAQSDELSAIDADGSFRQLLAAMQRDGQSSNPFALATELRRLELPAAATASLVRWLLAWQTARRETAAEQLRAFVTKVEERFADRYVGTLVPTKLKPLEIPVLESPPEDEPPRWPAGTRRTAPRR